MKTFLFILVMLVLAAGATWYKAGDLPGPQIEIADPARLIGQGGRIKVFVRAPDAKLNRLDITLEQGELRAPVFSLNAEPSAKPVLESDGRLRVERPTGKKIVPQLREGPARVTVTATRPVLFGLREVESTASRDIEVRLAPPQLIPLSTFHYINQGGSEMIVYRVKPADARSGVRVGDLEYPGYPASGAGIPGATEDLRVAFFALLWNQDPNTPMSLFARDEVGNEATAVFDYRVFPKKFRQSRIELDDRFLSRVVPAIVSQTPELNVPDASDTLGTFLRINGDLRRLNNERIEALASDSAPKILWSGAFRQLSNSAVEGGFADQRTYLYRGKEVDHQVHLGFDLASVANAPVVAANSGTVVHAGWLGIYGNCVIVDHGMGVQSLYAHLSSIEVKPGDTVKQGDRLGRSGTTGLAGGDHLHFTMLVEGRPVNPIDWWSPKWIQDRVTRKLDAAKQAQ